MGFSVPRIKGTGFRITGFSCVYQFTGVGRTGRHDSVPRLRSAATLEGDADKVSEYSASHPLQSSLKEQLRLFGLDAVSLPQCSSVSASHLELSKKERLADLLKGELDFHGETTAYASHDLHAFAAKFPPQLPRAFIRGLTVPGNTVLDPMMGSGTTIVEALLEGRRGFGLDLDPLALRLTRVKTLPLPADQLRKAGHEVLTRARTLLSSNKAAVEDSLAHQFEETTRQFIEYWFFPNTQRELMALALAIRDVENTAVRRFLELTLSSIIVTKSGGVSRARDLAHSRPHRVESKLPKNALEQFSQRFRKNLVSLAQLDTNGSSALLVSGDARMMPLADGVIDLVVTSPPYANAIDYVRAHKFSLVWLGASVADLRELRAEYIGSERTGNGKAATLMLEERPEAIIKHLTTLDPKRGAILRKYFSEMKLVLRETYRVLRDDSAAIIVVGTSTMRGLNVETHNCIADIAASVGFEVIGVAQRTLDRNKRMMPARFGKRVDSLIEQRMHEEYVIGLYKVPKGPKRADT